jgi:phage FluMu protein Com
MRHCIGCGTLFDYAGAKYSYCPTCRTINAINKSTESASSSQSSSNVYLFQQPQRDFDRQRVLDEIEYLRGQVQQLKREQAQSDSEPEEEEEEEDDDDYYEPVPQPEPVVEKANVPLQLAILGLVFLAIALMAVNFTEFVNLVGAVFNTLVEWFKTLMGAIMFLLIGMVVASLNKE